MTSEVNTSPGIGSDAYFTIGHELGHAIALKHGHEKGGVRNVSMSADRDSMEFSIMTYRSHINANNEAYINEGSSSPQSLMRHDIAALQHLYAADFSHNKEDTIYTFFISTGEMFVNGVGQGTPKQNRIFRTIWDGDRDDSYDFSNYKTNLSIDLKPGSWVDLDLSGNFQRANLSGGTGGGRHPGHARAHIFNALLFLGD